MKLIPTECTVLYTLMKNAGHTLSSEKIIQEVWTREYTNTDPVRTYISRLREKLNDDPPQVILTEHRGGYRFVIPS